MPRNPQIAASVEKLRAGEYGRVLGFAGFTLISLIQAPTGSRWEVKPEVSGGGALINAGGHVLSMIRAALGEPTSVTSEQVYVHSEDVEDSVVARFEYRTSLVSTTVAGRSTASRARKTTWSSGPSGGC